MTERKCLSAQALQHVLEDERGLLFPSLMPPEPGILKRVRKAHKDHKGLPHIGRWWTAAAPKHIFPCIVLQWAASVSAPSKGKGLSMAWSHGMRLSMHGQVGMLRLDARERYFDVVVWGDQPWLLMDELQGVIAFHLIASFSGLDHESIQQQYICPDAFKKTLDVQQTSQSNPLYSISMMWLTGAN